MPFTVERDDTKLTYEEVRYWKRFFKSNLKIGVEIETNLSGSSNSSSAMVELKSKFGATGTYAKFGKAGVVTVKGDGSLSNGIELCTIGRRIDYLDLFMQYNVICDAIIGYNPVMNERCGLHNHILLDYNSNNDSLEKPVPQIIMKNFIQLMRRYAPELVWITSTVNTGNAITRGCNYCKHETLFKYTPISRSMKEYKSKVAVERYEFINMNSMDFDNNSDITRLHFELRFPDGSLYPAQIAAQNVLYSAILLKAIELSELGVISCGDETYWNETKRLINLIRREFEGYSSSRTTPALSQNDIGVIKQRSKQMLNELKNCLDQYDLHVYGVLNMFAESPISIMRRSSDYRELNNSLKFVVKNMYDVNIDACQTLINDINCGVINAPTEQSWKFKAATKYNTNLRDVDDKLFKLQLVKTIVWDNTLGTYVFR